MKSIDTKSHRCQSYHLFHRTETSNDAQLFGTGRHDGSQTAGRRHDCATHLLKDRRVLACSCIRPRHRDGLGTSIMFHVLLFIEGRYCGGHLTPRVKHIPNGMPLPLKIVGVISLDNIARPGTLCSYSTGAKGSISICKY